MGKLVLTSSNVQLPNNEHLVPATVEIDRDSGKVVRVEPGKADVSSFHGHDADVLFYDFGDLYVLPGLVDAHVHLNEPGRTDWEGFCTGTRAAVAGGFTTVVDMPLNSIPPTTTVENLEAKRHAAQGQCWSDVAFWGGVIPNNQNDLLPLIQAGVKGFKCFLIESGVEEFPHVNEKDVKLAMETLEPTSSVLLFHAELDQHSQPASSQSHSNPMLYQTFLDSRPASLEVSAIDLIIALSKHHPTLRTHIVHLSSAAALPLIRRAKAAGLPITVETCFHYLCLSAGSIPHGHPEFKCMPPIRTAENQEQLWDALLDGTIDFVVSDHSPCTAELKHLDDGDIMRAWGGIGGLGLGLSLLWTEARKRGVSIAQIVQWLGAGTAAHAGLARRKGAIAVGKDADFVVFDPEAQFTVTKEVLNFKNKVSPYEGMVLWGKVEKTFLRGKLVWSDERAQETDDDRRGHFQETIVNEEDGEGVWDGAGARGQFGEQPTGILL